jgi:hypothetical protein
MPTLFPTCWPAALVLAVITVPAPSAAADGRVETRPVLDRVAGMKPVPTNSSDSQLRKLEKERFNARLAAAQVQVQAVQAGTGSIHDLSPLILRLAENGADLEEKPADRVKWFQMRVDILREQEQIALERFKAGASPVTSVHLATAARADAEIDLLKLKESLKGGK